jgi:hypothetical protein
MKKKFIFAVIILMAIMPFKSKSQTFDYDPFVEMSVVDPETVLLTLNVIDKVMEPNRTCLLHEKNEIVKDLYEWSIVIEHKGRRFSVYYNFIDYPRANSSEEFDKQLKIYTRPIGTESLDSLDIISDYYINGSWDRAWMNNQEFDGLSLLESPAYYKKQEQYVFYLHEILDYFNE